MNRKSIDAVDQRKLTPVLCRTSRFLVVATLLLAAVTSRPIAALAISMEHTPEIENPTWDPDRSILISHFVAAKAICESLLLDNEQYTIDFNWDSGMDFNALGETTPGIIGLFDTHVKINANLNW